MANLIPDDYAPAIGELVIAMSRLDSVLIDLIGIFAGTKILVTMTSFSHLQTTSKIDTLLALWHLGSTDFEKKQGDNFTEKMATARGLCDFRNNIVHAYWSISDAGEVSAVRFSARGEFKRSKRVVSSEEILEKAHEVGALEEWLRGLRDHMHQNPFRVPERDE